MNPDEDNNPDSGTDNVNPSENDTAADWDFYDPSEDTAETLETAAPDDEAEEGEPEAEAEETPVVYAEETQVVKLADGTEVPVADLKVGYLRQSDYTRKTQEVANERKAVSADVERMQRITTAFVDHLTTLIPSAPPASLALSDAKKYVEQKALHESAMAQVQQLIELGNAPKEISASMSEADQQRQLQEANTRLAEMFPETSGGKTREAFFNGVQSAASDLGFSNAELSAIRDPRVFALAHWAAKGMAAEKARATAKAKVASAPPATPRKPGQGAGQGKGNAEASARFNRTRSVSDAVKAWDGVS